MADLAGALESELRGMSRRIRKDPEHNVRGVVQLLGSDDPSASFFRKRFVSVKLYA